VNEKEINRRVRILTDLARQGRADYVNRWLGREVDVLIECRNSLKTFCRGVSENYLKLLIPCGGVNIPQSGAVLRCKIAPGENDQNNSYDAVGITCI
jgi:tRNA A37 methylthiotransferase MiaB